MVAWSGLASLFGEDDAFLFETRQAEREIAVAGAAKRRRLACQVVAEDKAAQACRRPKRRCGPQGKKHKDATPFSWAEHLARVTAGPRGQANFKRRYRLTVPSFNKLLGILKPDCRSSPSATD